MVGGKIKKIVKEKGFLYILVQDNLDFCWRQLEINSKTVCIDVGETIWWQSYKGYWSCGSSSEIPVGVCKPADGAVQ